MNAKRRNVMNVACCTELQVRAKRKYVRFRLAVQTCAT